jgi:hypothetical protein
MARLHLFSWELLELSTLNTRRFLFRLPESLFRWLDQASLGFARSAAKRTARFCKLRTYLFQCVCPKWGTTGPKRQGHQEALRAWNGRENDKAANRCLEASVRARADRFF